MDNKKIVTIGGGTGSFVLLSGLKKYSLDISAIVSMADDGGSTGRLRDELGVLPPGDVRQCLVALAKASETLRKLMNYRFDKGKLKGHSFGNLLLSALEKIEGSFSTGVEEAAKILNISGKVIPVSDAKMNLVIRLNNGRILKGEKQLDHNDEIRKFGIKKVYLQPNISACRKALEAISRADMIVIGPGDYYGSIIPNLLVEKISEAIKESKAKVVYVCNLTNKKGQTDGYNIDKYVQSLNKYIGANRVDFAISPLLKPAKKIIVKYEKREGKGSVIDFSKIQKKKRYYKIVRAYVLGVKKGKINRDKSDRISATRSFIRHDSDKLARTIIELLRIDERNSIKEIL